MIHKRRKESQTAQRQSSVTQNKRSGRNYFWKDWRVADVINGIIAVGTLITAYFSMQVWREAVNTTKISMLSTVSANRAWIVPLKARFNTSEDGQTAHNFEISFANFGREPAFNVSHEAMSGFANVPASYPIRSSEIRINQKNACEITKTNNTLVVHAAPGRDYSVILDPANYNKMSDDQKSKIFYIKGCFSYFTFGERRYSSYCLYLDRDEPNAVKNSSFSLCDEGNDAN